MIGRPPGKTAGLTDRQRSALEAIQGFVGERGYAPSTGDLAALLEIAPQSAHYLVKELEQKGYLRREPGTVRGLSVVRSHEVEGSPSDAPVSIPTVGVVAAGRPLLAFENLIGTVDVDPRVVKRGTCFALRVVGPSMQEAAIRDGDFVVVRRQPIAERGDVVVALFNGEATVKTLHIEEEVIELRPRNRRFKPIRVRPEDELQIVGKVVAVVPRERFHPTEEDTNKRSPRRATTTTR